MHTNLIIVIFNLDLNWIGYHQLLFTARERASDHWPCSSLFNTCSNRIHNGYQKRKANSRLPVANAHILLDYVYSWGSRLDNLHRSCACQQQVETKVSDGDFDDIAFKNYSFCTHLQLFGNGIVCSQYHVMANLFYPDCYFYDSFHSIFL